MKLIHFSLLCSLMTLPAMAADVSLPDVRTVWDLTGPPTSSASYKVDLSSAGVAGQPMRIIATATEPLFWSGAFRLGNGSRIDVTAILTLSYLGVTDTISYTWGAPDDGALVYNEGGGGGGGAATSNIAGYMTGPVPRPLSILLPANADLSAITFTLAQQMGGVNITYNQSSVNAGTISVRDGLRFSAQAVPEPSASLFLLASGGWWMRRRLRVAA